MNSPSILLPVPRSSSRWREEALCILLGVTVTFGLFSAIAHLESGEPEPRPAEIEELIKAMSVPLEPPPPKIQTGTSTPAPAAPLTGVEITPSASPVKIAVPPPDLASLLPGNELPPSATIQTNQLFGSFKPRMDGLEGDSDRIFQRSEVDQRPTVVFRSVPKISRFVRGMATRLRVTLLIITSTRGTVESYRIIAPSGNDEFDLLVAEEVKARWLFTPATRRGRPVRCLFEQPIRISWEGGSPFGS